MDRFLDFYNIGDIPFRFGRIVREDDFCNRKKEIALITQNIRSKYSIWLFSPRRFGKSSLILRVFKLTVSKKQKNIYFDLYNIKSADDFCRKYSEAITKELFNWKDDVKTIIKKAGRYFKSLYPKISFDETGSPSFMLEKGNIHNQTDIEQILQAPELIAKENGISICIAFDEFQEIDRIDPFIINWMRSVFQKQENVSYVFLGSRQSLMNKIFADLNSPFYEFAIKMDINPISYNDFYAFIESKFKKNRVSVLPKTIDTILQKSQLHPHFTQYFASVVYLLVKNGHDQSADNFTQIWINTILESQSIIFQGIFDNLTTRQRSVLVTLAKLHKNEELFSERIRAEYKLPASSTIQTVVKSLEKQSLIYKSNGKYMISNPVLKEWLLTLN